MRPIDMLVVHRSATRAGRDLRVADIDRWHRDALRWVGYHYVIPLDGMIELARS